LAEPLLKMPPPSSKTAELFTKLQPVTVKVPFSLEIPAPPKLAELPRKKQLVAVRAPPML
jgi:hypothetical protein